MKTFTKYLSSSTKEQIIIIYQFLGFTPDYQLKKIQLIAELLDKIINSSATWLKKLPAAELFTIQNMLNNKYVPQSFPYTLVTEKLHIVYLEDEKFYLSEELFGIDLNSIDEAIDLNQQHNFFDLETYYIGIIAAHGIIELSRLKNILKTIDADNYEYFISNSLLVRFFTKEIDNVCYVYHPSIKGFKRLFYFWKKAKALIPDGKSFSIEEYRNLGDAIPFIKIGMDKKGIKKIKNNFDKLGFNNLAFKFLYHSLFIANNEGRLVEYCALIAYTLKDNKNETIAQEIVHEATKYIFDVPLWIIGGYSSEDLSKLGKFNSSIDKLLTKYYGKDPAFEELAKELLKESETLNISNNGLES